MEFFLTSFGLHNPYVYSELPEHAIYPISDSTGDGIDLDYTSLLLGRKYYIDVQAYDYVCSGQKQFLFPMGNTLAVLKQEGLLETIDLKRSIDEHLPHITYKVESLASTPETWLDVLRSQWHIVKDEYSVFHHKFGSSEKEEVNTAHFPVLNYLTRIDERQNHKKAAKITKLLESTKKNLNSEERVYISEILKPLLAQILINDLGRTQIGGTILDWDDNEYYYNKLYLHSWEFPIGEWDLLQEARRLFTSVIPSLRPRNIHNVIKFIRNDKAVASLREELWASLKSGEGVSETWYKEFIDRIFHHELNMRSKMKTFRWLGSIANIALPGSSIVLEAAMEVVQNVTEDAIEARASQSYEWFYTLQGEALEKNQTIS